MSTSAAGTTFTLRTPAHIKSCHVTGSWDNYGKRYQMTADPAHPGWWSLTVKFNMAPSRYWYYYILDGYFESHDPNRPTCNEPTRKLTLNILDHEVPSPASSRRPSPNSSTRSSSASSRNSSKRCGGVYDIPNPAEYYPINTRRTPSPTRQHRQLTHIVHPMPRNPMAAHKLTLDTHYDHYGRPDSMISSAATHSSTSPVSDRSGSSCSTLSSRGSSPATPMCQCDEYEIDTRGHYCEEYAEEYDYDDEDREYQYAMAPPAKSAGLDDLAYRLERSLCV
ncbi:hypothetical protein BZA77DRAFT_152059 [Pyronema omphalodes]|nr:hypothetical protein BZA77DRAFT_152059 [Pyronema omphalodes]